MLRELDLSLEQAIQICGAAEEVKLQSKEIKGETKTSESLVDAVSKDAQRNTNEKRPRTMMKSIFKADVQLIIDNVGSTTILPLCACQNHVKM